MAAVEPDGIAYEVGIEPGDRLLSINGHPLRDVIDYRFYGAEEDLTLVVLREGQHHTVEIERDYGESLGISFADDLFDGIRECDNQCPFCFVAQLPPGGPSGLRRSLYVYDDDYRLSFLHGTFVTLTNLSQADWQRIAEQRPSPLYVSVHATNLSTRRRLLGNPNAPDIMEQLARLAELGIVVHAQIVVVPSANDGHTLAETIQRLLTLWPTVQTVALVPVGTTRFCPSNLPAHDAATARDVLAIALGLQRDIETVTGATWLYPSDELYLLAGHDVPSAAYYQDDAQRENGVGLVRALLDDWEQARQSLTPLATSGLRATLVCGKLIAPLLERLAQQAGDLLGVELTVVPVENALFGPSVTVSGLLTGADVLAQLVGRDLGALVCIPRAMLDAAGERALDDLTPADLSTRLGRPVAPVATMSEVVRALAELGGQGQLPARA